jgi:hypothetical protein
MNPSTSIYLAREPSACIYLARDDTDPTLPLYKVGKAVRQCTPTAIHRLLRSSLRNKTICHLKMVSPSIAEHLTSEIRHAFEQRYLRVRPSWFDGDMSQMIADMVRLIEEEKDREEEEKRPATTIVMTTPRPVEVVEDFHYGRGPTFRSIRPITKGDMVRLCETLSEHPLYRGVCALQPEPITEGGMVFRFLREEQPGPRRCAVCKTCSGPQYKSIRFRYGRFIPVPREVMEEWKDCEEVVYSSNQVMSTHLKSFHGAPPFTVEELLVLAEALCTIGLVNPSVAHLMLV